jgi:hypothetical protein
MNGTNPAAWFETVLSRLLTMRIDLPPLTNAPIVATNSSLELQEQ